MTFKCPECSKKLTKIIYAPNKEINITTKRKIQSASDFWYIIQRKLHNTGVNLYQSDDDETLFTCPHCHKNTTSMAIWEYNYDLSSTIETEEPENPQEEIETHPTKKYYQVKCPECGTQNLLPYKTYRTQCFACGDSFYPVWEKKNN